MICIMKQVIYTVLVNEHLTPDVCRMELSGDTSAKTKPGQFLNLKLDRFTLRRPISVCDFDEGRVTILYKIVGSGTAAMEKLAPGSTIDALSGLGNGFDISKSGSAPLLIGGGVGSAPLYTLCKDLLGPERLLL